MCLQQKEPEPTKEESDVDSDSPRKGRSSTPRGRDEPASTPTTRKAIKDEFTKTASGTKDSKSTPAQKETNVKVAQKETGKAAFAVQKDSPLKADKIKQDDKRKTEKPKDVKQEKEDDKTKAGKDEDTKKKKVVSFHTRVQHALSPMKSNILISIQPLFWITS